ncbi:hypothetical protein GALL_552500 [mine drainage metagenome]|uniref:Uncharacterized protein n=1 Tax=mine drainage metagenome TaxID=410659 RepID=A0A1J5NVG9_9ZZZZ
MQPLAAQLPVSLHVAGRLVAQHWAVGRRDHVDAQRFHQRQRLQHVLPERTHDVGVVVFESKAEIPDLVVEQTLVAEMTAEHVPGKQDALLFQISALRIRPVQIRRMEKTQGPVAQIHRVAGTDRGIVQVPPVE